MPMTFTAEMVAHGLEMRELSCEGTEEEMRERLASHVEGKFGDYVEGWEIRTGRPWNEMSKSEALALVEKRPELMRNPGVMSRLVG